MNTALGKQLQAIRQRIEAASTELRGWDELVDTELSARTAEAHDDGVTAERERWAKLLSDAKDEAIVQEADYPLAAALRDIRDAGLGAKAEPHPPAREPMTIATMIAKLSAVSNQNWNTIRGDLQELVQAQARRDAKIVEVATNQAEAQDVILIKAGLK